MKEARDPVCGMTVNPDRAAGSSVYGGQTYYFCGIGCKKIFDAEPDQYVQADSHVHPHTPPDPTR